MVLFLGVLRRRAVFAVLMLLAMVGLATVMSLLATANASPYPPAAGCTLSTSDQSVAAGQTLDLIGSGFPANSSVALTVHSAVASLGSVHTAADGSFSTSVTIPASLEGSHHIEAASGSSRCSMGFGTAALSVTRVNNAGLTAAQNAGGAAGTGFETLTASVIALALLGGGVLFILVGRQRREI